MGVGPILHREIDQNILSRPYFDVGFASPVLVNTDAENWKKSSAQYLEFDLPQVAINSDAPALERKNTQVLECLGVGALEPSNV